MSKIPPSFSNLSNVKLQILVELSEAALPIWRRFEAAYADDVPDEVTEATEAYLAIQDAAKHWLDSGTVDAEALQGLVDVLEAGANEAGENSETELSEQAIPAQWATVLLEATAWTLGQLAEAQITGQAMPDSLERPHEELIEELASEPELDKIRSIWARFVAA